MGKSGDPSKQERPDGQPSEDAQARVVDAMTTAMPPTVTGLITSFGAEVVPLPLFPGGKALELQLICGSLVGRFRVDPEFADLICEEIQQAAAKARSGLSVAVPEDVRSVARQAEAVRG